MPAEQPRRRAGTEGKSALAGQIGGSHQREDRQHDEHQAAVEILRAADRDEARQRSRPPITMIRSDRMRGNGGTRTRRTCDRKSSSATIADDQPALESVRMFGFAQTADVLWDGWTSSAIVLLPSARAHVTARSHAQAAHRRPLAHSWWVTGSKCDNFPTSAASARSERLGTPPGVRSPRRGRAKRPRQKSKADSASA